MRSLFGQHRLSSPIALQSGVLGPIQGTWAKPNHHQKKKTVSIHRRQCVDLSFPKMCSMAPCRSGAAVYSQGVT